MESAFYKEFPNLTKQDWLDKINMDLKDKDIRDLYLQIADDWGISPFLTKEDIKEPTTIQKYYASPLVGQSFESNASDLNEALLHSLENGLQSPIFRNVANIPAFVKALTGVNWEIITPVFECATETDAGNIRQALPSTKDIFLKTNNPKKTGSSISGLKSRHLRLDHTASKDIPGQLSDFALDVVKILDKVDQAEVKQTLNSFWIEMEQGPSFPIEIAKLRAVRFLWSFLVSHYSDVPSPLPIVAAIGESVGQQDPYKDMIAFTSASLYAMIGGADIVNVSPLGAEGTELSESFRRRISRNIPLIAELESFISKVEDPVAGSYAFEKLSQDLARISWKLFLEKAGSPQS